MLLKELSHSLAARARDQGIELTPKEIKNALYELLSEARKDLGVKNTTADQFLTDLLAVHLEEKYD